MAFDFSTISQADAVEFRRGNLGDEEACSIVLDPMSSDRVVDTKHPPVNIARGGQTSGAYALRRARSVGLVAGRT